MCTKVRVRNKGISIEDRIKWRRKRRKIIHIWKRIEKEFVSETVNAEVDGRVGWKVMVKKVETIIGRKWLEWWIE